MPVSLGRARRSVELELGETLDNGEDVIVGDQLDDDLTCSVHIVCDVVFQLGGSSQNLERYKVTVDLVGLVGHGSPFPACVDLFAGPLIVDLLRQRIQDHLGEVHECAALVTKDTNNCYGISDVALLGSFVQFVERNEQGISKRTLTGIVVGHGTVDVAFSDFAGHPACMTCTSLLLGDNHETRLKLYCQRLLNHLFCILVCCFDVETHNVSSWPYRQKI